LKRKLKNVVLESIHIFDSFSLLISWLKNLNDEDAKIILQNFSKLEDEKLSDLQDSLATLNLYFLFSIFLQTFL
jgi:hypothetical protein